MLHAHEPPYRSRGEAQVGRVLHRYGVPFVYERPTPVLDGRQIRVLHPDFTLPAQQWRIVEYAGLLDDAVYRQTLARKLWLYAASGWSTVLLTPRDLQGPDWPGRLYSRVVRDGAK